MKHLRIVFPLFVIVLLLAACAPLPAAPPEEGPAQEAATGAAAAGAAGEPVTLTFSNWQWTEAGKNDQWRALLEEYKAQNPNVQFEEVAVPYDRYEDTLYTRWAGGEGPDLVVFNGYADQYDRAPLQARVGERVRVWVLDARPSRPTSFHVVGAQLDTTYAEGAYLLRDGPGGAQSLGLLPSQGGFAEVSFPEPGDYPFVSHLMVDAERGAHGVLRVRPAAARGSAG